jgi:hypothetical protein
MAVITISMNVAGYAIANQKEFHPGEVVGNSQYGIKVLSATVKSIFNDQFGKVVPSSSGEQLIVLEVKLFDEGKPFKATSREEEELNKIIITDSKGNRYRLLKNKNGKLNFRYQLIGADPQKAFDKDGFIYQVFASIPNSAFGLKLQYRELPSIILGR